MNIHTASLVLRISAQTRSGQRRSRTMFYRSHELKLTLRKYHRIIAPTPYQLLRQPSPIADRQVEVEFLDPGVAVFDFTFG